jgi:calcium binding protein 39
LPTFGAHCAARCTSPSTKIDIIAKRAAYLFVTMVDPSPPKTPFDWLQGGLFFGNKNSSKGGDEESIDTCKDVLSLLNGISENLADILAQSPSTQTETTPQSEVPSKPTTPSELLAAKLSRLRFLLYDERRITSQQESRPINPTVAGTALQGLTGEQLQELTPRLLENLVVLPFESRKHVAAIFNYLLVCGLEGVDAALYRPIMELFRDYVDTHFDRIMTIIVEGHDLTKHGAPDIGLHFGSMYRSCTRHPTLYKQLVGTRERAERFVYPFLDVYVRLPNFEISSDAMESLRAVFAANGDRIAQDEVTGAFMAEIAADFLTRDYEEIWDQRFNPKLLSDSANYMTRRVALQILSSVLLTRSNYAVMIRYVASRANLIVVMKLLRDTSPHISLDAFHVFKIFVANPEKKPEVIKILQDNKQKLCAYLATLHQDKEDSDTQFRDEKALIIATIDGL